MEQTKNYADEIISAQTQNTLEELYGELNYNDYDSFMEDFAIDLERKYSDLGNKAYDVVNCFSKRDYQFETIGGLTNQQAHDIINYLFIMGGLGNTTKAEILTKMDENFRETFFKEDLEWMLDKLEEDKKAVNESITKIKKMKL